MATTVDTLLVRIEADMSDLKKSLAKVQRDVDKSSQSIGASFKKIGIAIKATVAAVIAQQAVKAGSYIVNLASDIEEMQGKSKVVFGEFRDQVVSDLEAFGDAVGRSTFELEGMASSIQDTFVPMGFARGAAADLSVELTKLAVDVASFNNASDTETMEAFQSALVGNHETVRRFGVVITEATLNQELMRMGIEKGSKAATNAQKVQARLNLITRGTADAHGDAARTADSFANRTRALKADLNELAGELGTILLPAVTQIVEELLAGAKAARGFLEDIGVLSRYGKGVDGLREQVEDLRIEFNNLADAEGIPEDQRHMEIYGNSLVAMKQRLLRTQEAALLAAEALETLNSVPLNDDSADESSGEAATDEPTVPKAVTDAISAANLETKKLKLEMAGYTDAQIKAIEKAGLLNELIVQGSGENIVVTRELGGAIQDVVTAVEAQEAAQKALNDVEAQKKEADKIKQKAIDDYNASAQEGLSYVLSNIRTNQELEETLKDLKAAYDAGKISLDEFALAQEQIKEKIAELDPVYKQMKDRANEAFDSVATSIADMVMSGSFDLKKLGDLFKQTMRQMIADALAAAVIKPILSAIFGVVGTAIPGPVGDFIGSIGGSAGGGSVSPYAPEIVGERGPELIVPKSASRILNNHDTKNALGMGSSTTIVQNINISTGVQQTVRSEIRSLMPEIANSAKAAVADGKRRGGSYGRAFA